MYKLKSGIATAKLKIPIEPGKQIDLPNDGREYQSGKSKRPQ